MFECLPNGSLFFDSAPPKDIEFLQDMHGLGNTDCDQQGWDDEQREAIRDLFVSYLESIRNGQAPRGYNRVIISIDYIEDGRLFDAALQVSRVLREVFER